MRPAVPGAAIAFNTRGRLADSSASRRLIYTTTIDTGSLITWKDESEPYFLTSMSVQYQKLWICKTEGYGHTSDTYDSHTELSAWNEPRLHHRLDG
jgi:hypothetical protein